MFNRREKIIKKDGAQPTELEEHVAKQLHALANKERRRISASFSSTLPNWLTTRMPLDQPNSTS